jgi:hypothetical protein
MTAECMNVNIKSFVSAIASHDHMVQMKQRILLEYSAKAAYFNDHPDYALYMMTITTPSRSSRS